MSIVKSFSVGVGDTFYIKHNSDNFTIIDCCLSDYNKEDIVNELKENSSGKGVSRFISTHPDEDHIQQLDYLDDNLNISNFYCVKNNAIKKDKTSGFIRYCELRDSTTKSYYMSKDCSRNWMNMSDEHRDSSGINIMWPDTNNVYFKEELVKVKNGESPNNISPIITYNIENSASFIWFGDLENDFMEKIKNEISFKKVNILFAAHHGRKSGRIIKEWLEQLNPDIIIIGEADAGVLIL